MKFTRILALVLAILMILPLVVACGNKNDDKGNQDVVGTLAPTGTDDAGNVIDLDPKLEAKDYKGYVFDIVSHVEEPYVADEILGMAVNDAVYERNSYIEQKYNIEISCTKVAEAGYLSKVEAVNLSSLYDEIDLLAPGVSYAYQLASQGHLMELTDIPNLNLDKPYWWQYVMDDTSIGGKNYFSINDSCQRSFYQIAVCIFNKDIMLNNKIENLYDLVESGDWTLEKMMEISRSAYSDTTGDGVSLDDTFGLTGNSWMTDCFVYGWNYILVDKDENQMPRFRLSDIAANQKFFDAFEKLTSFFHDPTTLYGEKQTHVSNGRQVVPQETFEDGRCLFWVESIGWTENLRKLDLAFGLLPVPKIDKDQEMYTNGIHSWTSATVCVLTSAETMDIDRTGRIVEDMAYASNYYVRPAYYDVLLKGQTVYDEESYDMLTYILDNVRVDLAVVLRQAGLTLLDDFRNFATNQEKAASRIERYMSSYSTIIDRVKTQYGAQ